MMTRRASRATARRVAMVATLGVVAAGLLIACHPLVNPVDPGSPGYTGVPSGTDGGDSPPAPAALLPSAVKWELVTNHAPGRMLPLEIPDDESFIEPRESAWFDLWITLSDSFDWEQTENAILWIAVTYEGGDIYYDVTGIWDVIPERRRLVIFFDFIPNQTRTRLRLVDRNGIIIGERVVGRLIGDVDGDGIVNVVADGSYVAALEGFAVSADSPDTIRADLDLNGIIEPNPGNDGNVISGRFGEMLPATAADFWD